MPNFKKSIFSKFTNYFSALSNFEWNKEHSKLTVELEEYNTFYKILLEIQGVVQEDSETRTLINLVRIISGIQFTDDKEIYNVKSIEDEFGDLYYEHNVYGSELLDFIDLNGYKQSIIEVIGENYILFEKLKEKYSKDEESIVNKNILEKIDEIDKLNSQLNERNQELNLLTENKRTIRKEFIEKC